MKDGEAPTYIFDYRDERMRKMKIVDLRSDTVTTPTKKMYENIQTAPIGDDVYGDDPTVNELESIACKRLNKENALFVPTGTMGNLIAVMAHTQPGEEIILERESHIFLYEAAGVCRLAGIQPLTIKGRDGIMDPNAVEDSIREENIHFPTTSLICVENTHNMAGGMIQPLDNLKEIRSIAKRHKLAMHLDGARVFNAAVGLNCDVKEISAHFDSVMFCLSKGLSAPLGSMLVGEADFIDRARRLRKMLGGGMRQAGLMASCGILSIKEMTTQLKTDHENAMTLGKGLNKLSGFSVDLDKLHTNIINVSVKERNVSPEVLVTEMKKRGILANPRGKEFIRLVTHKDVTHEDVEYALKVMETI